jgi:signal transduction histidine kinase
MTDQHVRIRFATDVLRRLGEELNPSVDQGIVELVKNAYDADATECAVELQDVDAPGGTVIVRDDGRGMTPEEIDNGWLVLGRSVKDPRLRTPLGRLPAGNKGLGRLAALRLGHRAVLRTRPASQLQTRHELTIDWDIYDNVDLVEEVPLAITTAPLHNPKPGTEIVIEEVRSRIGRMEVKRLARALVLLADPFGDDVAGFRPRLLAPEFDDLATLVEARYFPEADFHLRARLDAKGRAQAEVLDGYDKVLYRADHAELKGDPSRRYACPTAEFDLWAFILSAENFRLRQVSLREVREWLSHFGGVHLYVNGLRVAPYGNPGNDWLDMNLSRVRSPENRPGTNTSIGRLRVGDSQDLLVQKTDRSGVIETPAFHDLRAFALDALEFMARRRQAEAEQRRRKSRATSRRTSDTSRASLANAIETSDTTKKQELQQAFASYERATSQEIDTLRQEVQLYRTLSTAGITATTFAHESAGSPLKVMSQALAALERRGPREFGERFMEVLGSPLASISRAMKSLGVLGSVTLRLVEADKRRARRVDLHEVISEIIETFAPFFEQRDVKVDVELADGRPFLRASEAAVESILTNLLNNSLIAFEDAATDSRRVTISTEITGDRAQLRVADNGPGITGIAVKDIWLPGQTTRVHGTGLGLTIVRDAVTDLGGTVEALAQGRLGGAEFIVDLPILGA